VGRRRTIGGKPARQQHGEPTKPKRSNVRMAACNRHAPFSGQITEVARLTGERDDALDQLFSTSEVLKVFSASSGDLNSVFDTILENATRICEANFRNLVLVEGDQQPSYARNDRFPTHLT
jgi:hypothetical protein